LYGDINFDKVGVMKKFILVLAAIMLITSTVSAGLTENIYASKMAIQQITGRKVTDWYALSYDERLSPDKSVLMTQGAVELNGDGVKRLFWCHFDAKTFKLLRLKIDSQLLYSVIGW